MAMVFLTDRKLNSSNINETSNISSIAKENKSMSPSQANANIENMISIPRIKAPFNVQSKEIAVVKIVKNERLIAFQLVASDAFWGIMGNHDDVTQDLFKGLPFTPLKLWRYDAGRVFHSGRLRYFLI